jgi:hypothetical protein
MRASNASRDTVAVILNLALDSGVGLRADPEDFGEEKNLSSCRYFG